MLAVQWAESEPEDPKPVKVKGSKFLPNLLGHDAVTINRTIRVRIAAPSPGFLRHECWHVKQQTAWLPRFSWVSWLLCYLVWPPFRKRMEEEAKAKTFEQYPKVRHIEVIR